MAWLLYIFTNRFGINTYPDTIRPHPDTPRHSQTLPDTIQTPQDIDICMQYRTMEVNAISEYHSLLYFLDNIFGIDASPDTLRHHLDIIQTPSDTIHTPPDIDVFAIEGTGRKGNIRVRPNLNFANGFGIATSWDLLGPQIHPRYHPDTPRHNPDGPSYRSFVQYRALEEKAISKFHDLL